MSYYHGSNKNLTYTHIELCYFYNKYPGVRICYWESCVKHKTAQGGYQQNMSIHMLYIRFILSSGYAAHCYLQLSLVQVPSSLPLVCLFYFMKLPKISEANINLVESNVLVPPTILHDAVGWVLALYSRVTWAWILTWVSTVCQWGAL